MAPDITLYEYGPSRSRQVRWTLLELEFDFKSIAGVELLHSDELNKVNPMGKVPAVVIDGEPLFEAAAICTYLADLAPQKGLIAPSGTLERALHLQWVSFALSELEAFVWSNAKNTFVLPKEKRITALFEQNNEAYRHAAAVLDRIMEDKTYLVANRFSVTDIIVGFTLNWGHSTGLLAHTPNLVAYIDRLKERPHCTL